MGQSHPVYNTTQLLQHDAKTSDYIGKDARQSKVLENIKTNFVAENGFEKPAFKNEYGPMPHKGE